MNIQPEIEEIDIGKGGLSPFTAPDAYDPPKKDEEIPYEEMHPFLQKLIDEHRDYSKKLAKFEETLMIIESGTINREIDSYLREFFVDFDEEITIHNRQEEKMLFPLISKKMNEEGSHSKGDKNFNVIDVLEDDHIKSIQLAAITFNMFALFSRIPDEKSRLMILDVALTQGKELIELLKLHIYREDTIIFTYAHKNFSHEELTEIEKNS